MLEFRRFDPARCQFPRPRAALLPALGWSDLTLGGADTTPAALLAGPGVWHFSRGRYALAAAYRSAGIGPDGALLAPAYHCRTMLDPALALGGAIHFYTLNGDLTPKIESIKAVVAASRPAVRALVVPHYFGFEQPDAVMRELADFCSQQGVMLIEDCSHSWQVAVQRAPACQAGIGHVAVGSPYKFFPCADGGTLWGNPAQLSMAKQSRPGILSEAKALKAAFGHGTAGTRSRSGYPAAISAERGEDLAEFGDQPSSLYSRELEGKSSLALSRWVMGRTRLGPAVQRRRDNYRAWSEAVAGMPGGSALFPDLPSNCAPYMFPLNISAPDPQFFLLKQSGMPIWRWDDMAVSGCPVASEYRLQLLHLPCHQSLTPEQMQWMTSTVAKVLA
jgi:perosamine synthetase